MSNTKHTPGPWELITSHNDFSDTWFAQSKNQPKIFEVCAGLFAGDDERSAYIEAEATAKLIAAAPELLENLIRIIDRIEENGYHTSFTSAYERAKAAIKKATE